MKWLVLLLLIAAAGILIAVRYRRQIQTGIYVFRMFRNMRQMDAAVKSLESARENFLLLGKLYGKRRQSRLKMKIFSAEENFRHTI